VAMNAGGDKGNLKSDINVTPLVDVCLVLLIIFMVVTPLLQPGVEVRLPQTANPEKKPENSKQLQISVSYDTPPHIFVGQNHEWLPKSDFQQQMNDLYQRTPDKELVVRADTRLTYGDVKEVLKMIKDAGFQNVGIIAEQKERGAGGGGS
jgi:biopolymer transport protein TolR